VVDRQWALADSQQMLGTILRFLVYRVAGGRVLLALTAFDWLRRRLQGRRTAARTEARRSPAHLSTSTPAERSPR
jgi:hypothetical protein